MGDFLICRRRLIPAECIPLKDDLVLHRDASEIVTSWQAFRPRPDLQRGFSRYLLNEGIKVSRVFHADGQFHWYFDIADFTFNADQTVLTMTDLLVDVYLPAAGDVRVMDLDELADARVQGLLDDILLRKSLYTLDRLLRELYSKGPSRLTAPLETL